MNKAFCLFTAIILCITLLGCAQICATELESGSLTTKPELKPELTDIRAICTLSTLECYYHNVAKAFKPAQEGFYGIFENDRTFWVEYSGIVRIGIDLSNVEMDIHDSEITITLPPAKILAIKVDETSLNSSSLIASADGRINHNPITASDQTAAIHAAQEAMQAEAENNTALLQSAQGRAKSLINNYISQLAELSETPYSIVWNFT